MKLPDFPIIHVTGTTHLPNGKKVVMNRMEHVSNLGDMKEVEAAMIKALLARRDRGRPFIGDAVIGWGGYVLCERIVEVDEHGELILEGVKR